MIVTANQQALSNERGCFERKGPSDAGVTTDMIISTAKCAIDDSFYVRPTVQKPAGCIKLDPSPTLRTRPNYGPDCEGQVRLRLSDGESWSDQASALCRTAIVRLWLERHTLPNSLSPRIRRHTSHSALGYDCAASYV